MPCLSRWQHRPRMCGKALQTAKHPSQLGGRGLVDTVCLPEPEKAHAAGGSIIIMSSVAGLRGSAGLAGYCATKGSGCLFAKAAAMECAAAEDGIRVNPAPPHGSPTPPFDTHP